MPIYLKPARARRNMAVRILPDGTFEFDTPAEAAQFAALTGGTARTTSRTTSRPASSTTRSRPKKSSSRGRGRRGRKFEAKPAGTSMTFSQARTIGSSIGGMAGYCVQQEGESHLDALERVSGGSLDHPTASAVLDALDEEDLKTRYAQKDDVDAARARAILADVAGVVCDPPTRSNPWR